MQFFTALLEHLVVGVVALAWASPMLELFGLSFGMLEQETKTIGTVALCYLLGIYVDVLASPIVKNLRLHSIALLESLQRKSVFAKQHFTKQHFSGLREWFSYRPSSSYKRTAQIVFDSVDDRVRQCEVLVSRERIARGMVVNCLVFALIYFCVLDLRMFVLSILLSMASFIAWLRLKALSERFKNQLVLLLNRLPSASPNPAPDKPPAAPSA